jgi:NAD kinase
MYEKGVVVTRKTRLEELVERFNSKRQAKFYIEHSGGNFSEYQEEDDAYRRALERVLGSLEGTLSIQSVERKLVPSMLIDSRDVIVVVGQDGLVANVAKYIGEQPLIAINPDPVRNDGILLPFVAEELPQVLPKVLAGTAARRSITLAEAELQDGQRLLAFNDFFIGPAHHTSARYSISYQGKAEEQSSSGIIVSTGVGSTGWLSSVINMARGVNSFVGGTPGSSITLEWEEDRLVFAVREPFKSRHSEVTICAGWIAKRSQLEIESHMPSDGVIFSDGMLNDFLKFNSGARLSVRPARQKAQLVVP